MSGPQIPALAVKQVNDVFPGTVPRILGPGLSLFSNADGSAAFWDTASAGGLPKQFFIDPTIAQNNFPRFTTIQAAINYAVANLFTLGVFELTPGVTYVENLTLPPIGKWEITCKGTERASNIILGNILCSTDRLNLTNVLVIGNISGIASNHGASILALRNANVQGDIALTAVDGLSFWFIFPESSGDPYLGSGGGITGNILLSPGSIFGNSYFLGGTLSVTSLNKLTNCRWLGIATLNNTSTIRCTLTLVGCHLVQNTGAIAGAGVLPGPGLPIVLVDDFTADRLVTTGCTTTNCIVTRNVNNFRGAVNGNLTAQTLSHPLAPSGEYTIKAVAEMVTPGTSGTIALSVNYVDMTGHAVTEALLTPTGSAMTMAVTAAAATKAKGMLVISHNGSSAITFTLSGVGTAGPLAVNLGVTLRRDE